MHHWILLHTVFSLFPFGYECEYADEWSRLYGKVEHVSVLFRHGVRTPLALYPTDPHSCLGVWRIGYGELTKEGVRQHYVMGSWLGERYAHLLPLNRDYNRSAIQVFSSHVDRAIMSAAANMAGMFPLSPERYWEGINWYPVPIHTIPKESDNLIALSSRRCERYEVEYLKFESSEEYRQIMERFKGVLDFLEHMSGWEMDHYHFTLLYEALYIESLYGLSLPRWTREVFPDAMIQLVGLTFAFPTWTDSLKRLKSGFLLNTLLDNMKGKANGSLVANLSVYSGHDTTVSALLHAMGVYDLLPPPFAATVLLELRRISGSEPVVTIFYKNSSDPRIDPVPLYLPGCSFACPLSTVENLWAPLLVTDWDKECRI